MTKNQRNVPDWRHDPRAFLAHLYIVAVERALPLASMGAHLPAPPPNGRTLVLGAGKAAGSMAQAVEALWPADAPLPGLVVTRYGHVPPRPPGLARRIEVVEAAHPVPDEAGERAAERVLALAGDLTADDLVLCLISGGGSALATLPAAGLTLADKQRIHRELLASGADIGEMNCVRKHLSRIKGGRLAAACAPGSCRDIGDQRCTGRRSGRDRQRPDRVRRHHLRRGPGNPGATADRSSARRARGAGKRGPGNTQAGRPTPGAQ